MSKVIIEFQHVKKNYEIGNTILKVLKDVNFRIYEGESICLLGRSGSGKTTALNLLTALDKPTEGKIFIESLDIHSMPPDEQSKYRLLNMGYIFQEFHLLEHFTALENVMVPMILANIEYDDAKEKALDLLDMMDLSEKALSLPSELSSGQKQRISIARAIANQPKILIADEPTGLLDSKTSDKIMNLLLEIVNKETMTMVFTTHDSVLAKRAKRIMLLDDGKIVNDNLKPEDIDTERFYEVYQM